MRKLVLSLSLLAATTLMAAQPAPLKTEELMQMNFFKNKGITLLGETLVGNMTLVSVSAQTPNGPQRVNVFVTQDKKYVIVGSGFSDKSGEPLVVPMDMSNYAKDAGFTFGTGKNELFVFTDPECPFCKRMEQEVLSKLSLSEYTVHVFLFPLSFHKHAEAMSMWIMSQKTAADKMNALDEISNGSNKFESASYTEAERGAIKASLTKQMSAAQALGVSGTPSIFDGKGSPVNWMSLAPKH